MFSHLFNKCDLNLEPVDQPCFFTGIAGEQSGIPRPQIIVSGGNI
jgi:hypothetical protein